MSTTQDDAARLLSDMNTFAIVRSILGGGHIQARNNPEMREAIRRIETICRDQEQKLYRSYAAISEKTPPTT